tara:strand:- start:1808 stop:2074 length:267 start_codon:yes stop_codon:yes gene_type:complete
MYRNKPEGLHTMEITNEQRLDLLKSYNELKDVLTTVHECQDLWMSDIRKLENLQSDLHRILKFVPKEDDAGRSMHYADWVLAEHDEND